MFSAFERHPISAGRPIRLAMLGVASFGLAGGAALAIGALSGAAAHPLLGGATLAALAALAGLALFAGSASWRAASSSGPFDVRRFLDKADEGAFVAGLDGRIVEGNAHFAALVGIDPEAVAGGDLADILPGPIMVAITVALELRLDSTGAIECENSLGEWLIVELQIRPLGAAGGFGFVMRDLTEAKRREIELATLAFQDPLTRLANRAALDRRMARLADDLAESPEASFAVMVLDLDRFKQVNDRYGHAAGDELLAQTARRVADAAPRNAFIARAGGDEFAIVVGPRVNMAFARQVAAQIIEAVAAPTALSAAAVEIGVSIGVALAPADGEDSEALLAAADAAMYRAKRSGTGVAFATEPEVVASLKSVA
jgi:diguanylate cyclase (GGDEF)-like protein/PAS domain S-box-containing protein